MASTTKLTMLKKICTFFVVFTVLFSIAGGYPERQWKPRTKLFDISDLPLSHLPNCIITNSIQECKTDADCCSNYCSFDPYTSSNSCRYIAGSRICRNSGLRCRNHGDCCSGYCDSRKCLRLT